MRQRLIELLCILTGHRLSVYDTDMYGPVLVCDRCLSQFEYNEGDAL